MSAGAVLVAVVTGVVFAGVLPVGAVASDTGSVTPHRAAYQFSLGAPDGAGVGREQAIDAVTGTMDGEWRFDCDGWTVLSDVSMSLFDRMGGAIQINSTFAAWEEAGGAEFSFSMEQSTGPLGGEAVDISTLRGAASREAGVGEITVDYRLPDRGKEVLSAETMFPMEHFLDLIRRAGEGETFYSAPVFLGSEVEWREIGGAYDISAAITPVAGPGGEGPLIEGSDAADLLHGPAWQVHLAHFARGGGGEQMSPDFETSFRLFQSGVSDRIRFDYGSFIVEATLDSVEELPMPVCD